MKILFIFILSLTLGIAQGIPADITLVSVNVEGNAVTSENTILFTAGLREGQTISQAEFPRAIKRLWQLGLFQDIQLRYDNETDEGLSLTILVKENFILGDLSYDGNKKIKDRKFEDEISLSKGQRLRPNTLHETAKKIKELYEEKGYLNAEINPVLEIPVEESTLFDGRAKDLVRNVVFNIQENDRKTTIVLQNAIIYLRNGERIEGDVFEIGAIDQYIVVRTERENRKRIRYRDINYILHNNSGLTDYLQAAGKEPEPEPPKPGILIIIVDPPETNISVGYKQYKANAVGHASIELPVGKHDIKFKLKGFEKVTKKVSVSANEKISLDIQMYLSKTEEKSDDSYVMNTEEWRAKKLQEYKNRNEKLFNTIKKIKDNIEPPSLSSILKSVRVFVTGYCIYLIVLGLLPPG